MHRLWDWPHLQQRILFGGLLPVIQGKAAGVAMTDYIMSALPHLSSAEAMGLTLFIACLFLWGIELWLELFSPVCARLCSVLFAVADCEEVNEETPTV